MSIELTFTADLDWYDSNDERYDIIITGTYTPEQSARINCLPEDAEPGFGSEFEITSAKFDGLETEVPQSFLDDKEIEILEMADNAASDGGYW